MHIKRGVIMNESVSLQVEEEAARPCLFDHGGKSVHVKLYLRRAVIKSLCR